MLNKFENMNIPNNPENNKEEEIEKNQEDLKNEMIKAISNGEYI